MSSAVSKFKENFGGSRIEFTGLGLSRTEKGEALEETAGVLQADKSQIRLSRFLISSKNPYYSKVTTLKSKAKSYWRDNTLPYVERNVRLVRIVQIPVIRQMLETYQNQIAVASIEFYDAWPEIVQEARQKLGPKLFRESDYMLPKGPNTFCMMSSWPSLVPPAHLQMVDPEEHKKQMELFQAKMTESYALAEQAMLVQIKELFAHLIERCAPDPSGKKKVLKAPVLQNFRDFFEKLKGFGFESSPEVEALLKEAQSLVGDVQAKDLKTDQLLRETLVAGSQKLMAGADSLLQLKGGRKLLLKPTPAPEETVDLGSPPNSLAS